MPGLGLSIGIQTQRGPFVGGGGVVTPSDGLLLESGASSFLLLEDASFLLLE